MGRKPPPPPTTKNPSTAIDPDLPDRQTLELRERLARAGLLLTPTRLSTKRLETHALARARATAGHGRPLSDFVAEGRR
jgi:hypothetical protein